MSEGQKEAEWHAEFERLNAGLRQIDRGPCAASADHPLDHDAQDLLPMCARGRRRISTSKLLLEVA